MVLYILLGAKGTTQTYMASLYLSSALSLMYALLETLGKCDNTQVSSLYWYGDLHRVLNCVCTTIVKEDLLIEIPWWQCRSFSANSIYGSSS
ncbi:hypothetical protein CW304_22405 [Bacillus sp. UFRGS-B20]|nr:hypothetical protein CW304_22405 [Bacillus sp. UFRGS-B20]